MKNDIACLESDLQDRVRRDEDRHSRSNYSSDSLYDHLERVAKLAEKIGRTEGVDPTACRLAGLFHDAGKFATGKYRASNLPEEEHSVEALVELAKKHNIDNELVKEVADAIRQIYRDDPDLTPLARVLFDADNLDKLGPLGIANYFIRTGLRGGGVSENMLFRLTVELTYARYASLTLATKTGRGLARSSAAYTVEFVHDLLDSLRENGLYDFRVEEIDFNGLTLDAVAPAACSCGSSLGREIWEVRGMKCSEIHLNYSCPSCGKNNEIRFCRPRLDSERND